MERRRRVVLVFSLMVSVWARCSQSLAPNRLRRYPERMFAAWRADLFPKSARDLVGAEDVRGIPLYGA